MSDAPQSTHLSATPSKPPNPSGRSIRFALNRWPKLTLCAAAFCGFTYQAAIAQESGRTPVVTPQTMSPEAKAALARRTGATNPNSPTVQKTARIDYALRAEVLEFIAEMVAKHQFNEEELKSLFAAVRFQESVVRLMTPAAPNFKRSWEVYRRRFIDATRINAGVEFWTTHADATKRASQAYGVPEEIIMAIIGVETVFGRVTGDYRVMDALTILTFDYPRRAEFFRGELENFLIFTRDMQIKPFTVKGSYAGAIGYPQFMPSSIRRFATDFDGDGQIDLRGSATDAIGSVAKFLADHGWKAGEPIVFDVKLQSNAKLQELIAAGIEPKFNALELADSGVEVQGEVPADMKLALIDLPNGDNATSYMAGPRNFYVITRYNRSSFYAMAVRDLALSLSAAKKRQ
jgi:membrane-bound lytic murein transglycosylase B